MKRILLALALLSAPLIADTNNIPDTAVIVSTDTVVRTQTKEPRTVIWTFADDGKLSVQIDYEIVVRLGGRVESRRPLKISILSWDEVTNAVPALAEGLVQFKTSVKASLTNTP